ncbi:MAG TPA: cysteine rich repeat-containing protein [Nitrospira sp.]|nr:cysteine rich repeat-containing protein [Nitrospira sp.]
MAHAHESARFLAGVFSVLALGLVWLAVVISLPTQQELAAKEPVLSQRTNAATAVKALSEPLLDLSIPGVPPTSPASSPAPDDPDQPGAFGAPSSPALPLDPHAAQVARLRCEAEIEQLCPDSLEGPARKRCLEQRAHHLAAPCQQQLRERFVKWKEERSRFLTACQTDVKHLCASVKPGGGQILQCLQEHAQEVSDRCYETLPKGTVYFKH